MSEQWLVNDCIDDETIALLVDQQNNILDMKFFSGIKQNIYSGKVTGVDHSMQVAFVTFSNQTGFLPLANIRDEYFEDNIKNLRALKDQFITVQVEKDPRGTKGAYLTTYLTLSNKYCVLMTDQPAKVHCSRQLTDTQHLKQIVPEPICGLLWRTNAKTASDKQLRHAYKSLLAQLDKIKESKLDKIKLLYEYARGVKAVEQNVQEPVCDALTLEQEQLFFSRAFFQFATELVSRNIRLPSKASLTIDFTEALISVDVNSNQSKCTAVTINQEAIEKCAQIIQKQNLSGLIVIDLIDMQNEHEYSFIDSIAKKAFEHDKARIKLCKINKLGLLELTRQRIGKSLYEYISQDCCACKAKLTELGHGFLARSFMRKIYHHIAHERPKSLVCCAHVSIVGEMLTHHQKWLGQVQKTHHVKIILRPQTDVHMQSFKIQALYK